MRDKFVIFDCGNYLQQGSFVSKPIWGKELSTAMRCASRFGARAISEVTGGKVLYLDYQEKPTHEYIWHERLGTLLVNPIEV